MSNTRDTSRNHILLPLILSTAQHLADECDPIRFTRTSQSRQTRIQKYLVRISSPLRSLSARLRRGLLVASLDQDSYTAFAQDTLVRFERDLLALYRTLDNRARKTHSLLALVEKTSDAVVFIDEKDRVLTLNALCCAWRRKKMLLHAFDQ